MIVVLNECQPRTGGRVALTSLRRSKATHALGGTVGSSRGGLMQRVADGV